MNKVLMPIFFTILIVSFVFATDEKFLLWESFEDITPPAWPSGWTVENTNGDDKTWETKKFGGLPVRHQCVRYAANPALPANDWFFTPVLTLSSGIQYKLSFRYKVSSHLHPEKIAIWIGNAPSSGNMTTQIFNNDNITDTVYREATVNFTVPTSGNYHIGFRCYSDANRRRLFVDDILLSYPTTGLKVTLILAKQILNRGATPIYSLTDTIECYFIIENIGPSNLIVNTSFNIGKIEDLETELSYIVIEPDGDTMPLIALITPEIGSRNFEQLNPGKIASRVDNLQKIFRFTQTGTYSIRALYKNYHKSPGQDIWLGKIISTPVTFIVQ